MKDFTECLLLECDTNEDLRNYFNSLEGYVQKLRRYGELREEKEGVKLYNLIRKFEERRNELLNKITDMGLTPSHPLRLHYSLRAFEIDKAEDEKSLVEDFVTYTQFHGKVTPEIRELIKKYKEASQYMLRGIRLLEQKQKKFLKKIPSMEDVMRRAVSFKDSEDPEPLDPYDDIFETFDEVALKRLSRRYEKRERSKELSSKVNEEVVKAFVNATLRKNPDFVQNMLREPADSLKDFDEAWYR